MVPFLERRPRRARLCENMHVLLWLNVCWRGKGSRRMKGNSEKANVERVRCVERVRKEKMHDVERVWGGAGNTNLWFGY